jgi:hypothetical protein
LPAWGQSLLGTLEHRRIDQARMNCVHTDSVLGEIVGRSSGQAEHGHLAGGVRARIAEGAQAVHR